MKKMLLILFSLGIYAQPLMSVEQTSAQPKVEQQQPKKTFWTKTKIALATAGVLVTTTVVAFFGHKLVYGEQKPGTQPSRTEAMQSPELLSKQLFVAAMGYSLQDVQELINKGASPATQNSDNETPLLAAVNFQQTTPEVITLFCKGEINGRSVVNIPDNNGETPLSSAVDNLMQHLDIDNLVFSNKDLKIINILVDNGATAQRGSLTSKLNKIRISQGQRELNKIFQDAMQLLQAAESRVELKLK